MSITQVYTPTSMSSEEELENFYDDLQTTMSHDKSQCKIIMGDFNPKVGEGNEKHVWGNLDTELEMKKEMSLTTFLLSMTLKLITVNFRKKNINKKWTWRSPNHEIHNEIDYILTKREDIAKYIKVLNNVGSDHCMVICKVQVNFKQERSKMFHTKP